MSTSYSIAEARNNFAALVRDAEESNQPIDVTRRGESVAVLLSKEEYERLVENRPKQTAGEWVLEWRKKWNIDEMEDDGMEDWWDVRDKSPAPDNNPWL